MFEVFPIVRDLHELLWYLSEASTLLPDGPLQGKLRFAFEETKSLTHNSPEALLRLDMGAQRRDVNTLLLRTSELVRAGCPAAEDYRGADLIGARLRMPISEAQT